MKTSCISQLSLECGSRSCEEPELRLPLQGASLRDGCETNAKQQKQLQMVRSLRCRLGRGFEQIMVMTQASAPTPARWLLCRRGSLSTRSAQYSAGPQAAGDWPSARTPAPARPWPPWILSPACIAIPARYMDSFWRESHEMRETPLRETRASSTRFVSRIGPQHRLRSNLFPPSSQSQGPGYENPRHPSSQHTNRRLCLGAFQRAGHWTLAMQALKLQDLTAGFGPCES